MYLCSMIDNRVILSAPIQGWTDHVWRTAHAQVFGGVDAYYAPFMRVEHGTIRPRDIRDILPENNPGIHLVPQVLACRPDDMERMLNAVADMGYGEVDINLGCPHPPVARKGNGAGMLAHPDALRQMFDTLSRHPSLRFSLKLRLGWDDASQWHNVLPLLDAAHITQVIIHYRLGIQQYKGEAMLDRIGETLDAIKVPVVLNGDIDSTERIGQLLAAHQQAAGVMVGRALVADPALLCPDRATPACYRDFHDLLYEKYREELTGGDHQILNKMQSLWERMLPNANHRARKAIRKATTLARYEEAVAQLIN